MPKMNNFKRLLDSAKFAILAFLSALLIYPISLVIFIPISLYKILLSYLVKQLDPKICQIISGLSAVMSRVNRIQVIDIINKQILTSKQFPELSQRIVRKFGYNFWYEADKTVSAADHVHYLNPKFPNEPVLRSQILELDAQNIARKPMPEDRSPWEIILVPNLIDDVDPSNKSLAIFRTHHCLMDGYSIINFMKKAAVKSWKEPKVFRALESQKTSKWKALKQFLVLLATGPYHLINQAIFNNDNSEFMKMIFLNQQKSKDPRPFFKSKAPIRRISMDRLQNIKKLHNVNVSSVIITLVMGATAKFIKKRFGKVEQSIRMQMSYPVPGHPTKPTNHWTHIGLPIHFQENDPVKTLKWNNKEYEKIRNSVIPMLNFCVANLLGQVPVFLIPNTEDLFRQTVTLSNLAGTMRSEDIFGHAFDEMTWHGVTRNGTAFMFGSICIGGKLGIDALANSDLCETCEDIEDINESIEDILKKLES